VHAVALQAQALLANSCYFTRANAKTLAKQSWTPKLKRALLVCRCGDLYDDAAIQTFNCCAVSDQKCVPQLSTELAYPVPPPSALVPTFDPSQFTGRWYITAGYNPLFDTFDCQEHFFTNPEPGKLFGKINWRISTGDDFLERSTVQRFVQVRLAYRSKCKGSRSQNLETNWSKNDLICYMFHPENVFISLYQIEPP
jgi:violaxanthin de-epoxidase